MESSNWQYDLDIRSDKRDLVRVRDYDIMSDRVTFLFGESGIGKSMISKAVYGLLDPDELNICLNGEPYVNHLAKEWTKEIKENSFFVFQEPSSHLNPLLKLSDQLSEGSLMHAGNEKELLRYFWQNSNPEKTDTILKLFPKPYRPSGGEKQRLLLAMAFKKLELLANAAADNLQTLYVFDEPTGSLDNHYRNLFLDLLFEKFKKKAFTAIVITHDYSIISEVRLRHPELLNQVHYQELRREQDGSVRLYDFRAGDYLEWLDQAAATPVSGTEEEVLRVQSGFRIFGRDHSICANADYTGETDLVIHRGEMVYLKAPSGVGKTTLAKIVMGLLQSEKAEISLSGIPLDETTPEDTWSGQIWGRKAGMVFQHADEALNLQATVRETFKGLPLPHKPDDAWVSAQLGLLFEGDVGPAFLSKKVAALSGGQKQRLNLLRTLVQDTDLVVLDEPLNGLDFLSIQKVLRILEEKRKRGTAFLMISHNEEIFSALIDERQIFYLK